MQWVYEQTTGRLMMNGQAVAQGYSGHGGGKNNPEFENVEGIGPIPRGLWRILPPRNSKKTGKYVLPLEPVGHLAYGRKYFQIHGDSTTHPGEASTGCIVLPRNVRIRIWESGFHQLDVVK